MSGLFKDKRILVTGGTGSLGQVLTRRLMSGTEGVPESVTVFSRDEAKQHRMRLGFMRKHTATDEVIFENCKQRLRFLIGDVRDGSSLLRAARDADVVFSAAALKQVPSCEYFPWEACRTNIGGAENLVRAIAEHDLPVETVIGISTDKACKPVNVMGMTKASRSASTSRAASAPLARVSSALRYGNVLGLKRLRRAVCFLDQIAAGGPVTITTPDMTRFLLTLEDAVDTIFAAVREAEPGDVHSPAPERKDDRPRRLPDRGPDIETVVTGIRPGEKIHEPCSPRRRLHGRSLARRATTRFVRCSPSSRTRSRLPPDWGLQFRDALMPPDELAALLEGASRGRRRELPGVLDAEGYHTLRHTPGDYPALPAVDRGAGRGV